ncbi:jg3365 [Pararge aegeria aegeria]|uniref:Jg3365 protein n=1 Tax=Pararge aegeria aegeria TaxID=348720 RepID=A0A8S4RR08_9NEOP|nr:jg3365 [Pararge aegeria aegeria]
MYAGARVDCFYATKRKNSCSLVRRFRGRTKSFLKMLAGMLDCRYGRMRERELTASVPQSAKSLLPDAKVTGEDQKHPEDACWQVGLQVCESLLCYFK